MSTLTFLAASLASGLTTAALLSSRLGQVLPNRLDRLHRFHRLTPARADETADPRADAPATTPADDRGITLQTLIVTAVLVLMAVAAGVVIVAITNSSSDDLEGSGTDVAARCNSVEIYDPLVASRNELGIHEGTIFQGSAIGCIPVCVLDTGATGAVTTDDTIISADELNYSRGTLTTTVPSGMISDPVDPGTILLGQQPFLLADGRADDGTVEVHGLGTRAPASGTIPAGAEAVPIIIPVAVDSRIDRIAVAPNQNQCLAYDANGDPILP